MRRNESEFLIAACAALAVLIFLTGCAGPAATATTAPAKPTMPPTPAPTEVPSATPDTTLKTFRSERYGYTVTYSTKDWAVLETKGEWAPDTLFEGWYPGTDTFSSQKSSDIIVIAAQPVPDGVTMEQRVDSNMKIMSPFITSCDPPEDMEPVTVGGEPTVVKSIKNCPESENLILVWIIHNGKGYGVYTRSTGGDQSDDWPNLEKLLSTWTFTD